MNKMEKKITISDMWSNNFFLSWSWIVQVCHKYIPGIVVVSVYLHHYPAFNILTLPKVLISSFGRPKCVSPNYKYTFLHFRESQREVILWNSIHHINGDKVTIYFPEKIIIDLRKWRTCTCVYFLVCQNGQAGRDSYDDNTCTVKKNQSPSNSV